MCGSQWGGIGGVFDGPAGIRTQNQGIHFAPRFPAGVDYLFTLAVRDSPALAVAARASVGCGTLSPVIKGTSRFAHSARAALAHAAPR